MLEGVYGVCHATHHGFDIAPLVSRHDSFVISALRLRLQL